MKRDLWAAAIRHIFYPLWMIYDGNRRGLKYLNYFEFLEGMSRDQLLRRQKTNLKAILTHAYHHTAYYRQLFDERHFDPAELEDPGQLRQLPFLTKDIVRTRYSDLIADNIPPEDYSEASTGGSTGVPMKFLRDKECLLLRRGQELFFDRWMGYRIGDKIGYFVSGSHFDGRLQHLKARLKNATGERVLSFDPHDINDAYMAQYAAEFQKFRPKMIKCFPNALTPFAMFVKKMNLTIPVVQSVSCTGENLYEQQRQLFETIFHGEVFEKVGTRESGVIACECRQHEGLHIFTEGIYLEVLDADGRPAAAGEPGKIIVTDLFNRAMPLIRYDIGDMAIAAGERDCACGSQLPLIEKYIGRDRDIIIDSDGNPKPGYLFVEVIKNLNLNAQIQIIQQADKSIKVNIVNNSKQTIDTSAIKMAYQEISGPDIAISFQFIDKIEREPSGKFSYVKSAVKYGE